MARLTQIQFRRDTETNWEAAQATLGATPVLAAGELGFISSGTNAGKFKVGRAGVLWASLDYVGAGLVSGELGGTGVVNTGKTITLGGNLTTSGAYATTLVSTDTTSVTLPTSGTLAKTDGSNWDPYVSAPKLWFSPTADYTSATLDAGGVTPWSKDGANPLTNGVTVSTNTTYKVEIVMTGYFSRSIATGIVARAVITGDAIDNIRFHTSAGYSTAASGTALGLNQSSISSITAANEPTQLHSAASTSGTTVYYRLKIIGILRTGAVGSYFLPKLACGNTDVTFTMFKSSYISLIPMGSSTTQFQGTWT